MLFRSADHFPTDTRHLVPAGSPLLHDYRNTEIVTGGKSFHYQKFPFNYYQLNRSLMLRLEDMKASEEIRNLWRLYRRSVTWIDKAYNVV